jgi:hypothetical protein
MNDSNKWVVAGTLAGILAATVAVLTFVGFIPFGPSHSPGPTPSPSLPGRSSASTPSTSPTATKSTPPAIYYQGPVLISGFPGLDFDIKPPAAGPDAVSISYNTFALKGGSSTVGLAVWRNGGTPMATDCKTLVSTQQVPFVYQPVEGMKICFKTDQGRIGLLVVQRGTSEDQFNAIATVWGS